MPTATKSFAPGVSAAAPFALAFALVACGSRGPRTPSGDASAYSADSSQPQTIYVFLGAPPEEAEVPAEAAVAEAQVADKPAALNPFAITRTWTGDYLCPQGPTAFTLRVVSVSGLKVDAIFDFLHAGSGAAGSYYIAGHFDPETRVMAFAPGAWITQPPGYVTVGMTGDVADDGSLFTGHITDPSCGSFRLRSSRK